MVMSLCIYKLLKSEIDPTVEIIIIREGEDRFHVEVWRSFAAWLWTAFTAAASH
jgi:heterotetrameric sarcosine oxidase gamma subunit